MLCYLQTEVCGRVVWNLKWLSSVLATTKTVDIETVKKSIYHRDKSNSLSCLFPACQLQGIGNRLTENL